MEKIFKYNSFTNILKKEKKVKEVASLTYEPNDLKFFDSLMSIFLCIDSNFNQLDNNLCKKEEKEFLQKKIK